MAYVFEHCAVVMMGEFTIDNGDIALADVEVILYEQEMMLSVSLYKCEIAIWTYNGDDTGMAECSSALHGLGAERHCAVCLRMRNGESRRGGGNHENRRSYSPSSKCHRGYDSKCALRCQC